MHNSPVSQLFFPIDEQHEQHILAHKSQEPMACCRVIFHKYCCYINHECIITNWSLYEILGGIFLLCQNTTMRVYGAWIRIYCFYVQKHKAPLAVCSNLLLVHEKPLGLTTFVRLTYSWDVQYLPTYLKKEVMMLSRHGLIIHITGPLCRESTGNQWIPCTKDQ